MNPSLTFFIFGETGYHQRILTRGIMHSDFRIDDSGGVEGGFEGDNSEAENPVGGVAVTAVQVRGATVIVLMLWKR